MIRQFTLILRLVLQPYVSCYDTVKNEKIPEWIMATIGTRNDVFVSTSIMEESKVSINDLSKLYRHDYSAFWKGATISFL